MSHAIETLRLTASQSAAMRMILLDPDLVQAGAWMVSHFRVHTDGVITLPLAVDGLQDPTTDIRVGDWPFGDDPARTREALDRFVAADLLVREGADRYRRTDLGAVLIAALPLYQVRDTDAIDRRFPELRERVRGARVMDAGCGLGPFALQFAALGARQVIGVDYAPHHLAYTRLLRDCVGAEHLVLLRTSVEKLPLRDACLDLVFCRVVLPHVHKGRTMAEFTRVLRPGGHMLLAMHSVYYNWRRFWSGVKAGSRSGAITGFLGLFSGVCFDLFGCEPEWNFRSGPFRVSYERRGTFQRLIDRNRLELLSWEPGVIKPYVWVRKP